MGFLCCCRDCFGVDIIVLLRLDEQPNKLRPDQTHLVAWLVNGDPGSGRHNWLPSPQDPRCIRQMCNQRGSLLGVSFQIVAQPRTLTADHLVTARVPA
jgi:hypothetical protein